MTFFVCNLCGTVGGAVLYIVPVCPNGHGPLQEHSLKQFVLDNTHEKGSK